MLTPAGRLSPSIIVPSRVILRGSSPGTGGQSLKPDPSAESSDELSDEAHLHLYNSLDKHSRIVLDHALFRSIL